MKIPFLKILDKYVNHFYNEEDIEELIDGIEDDVLNELERVADNDLDDVEYRLDGNESQAMNTYHLICHSREVCRCFRMQKFFYDL